MQRSKLSSRRTFIQSLAGGAAGLSIMPSLAEGKLVAAKKGAQISCTSYSWFTFYQREGKEWMADPQACINDYLRSGLLSLEPGFENAQQVEELAPILKKHGIAMPSVYIGTTLHDPAHVQENIDRAVSMALAAKKWGTKIIVTNPSPIRWGMPEDKDDAALTVQAESLDKLGSILAGHNMIVAYHNHDMEMRQGAREFHHMLSATNPRFVSFCLDVHWVYRGMGNSIVGLFDVVRRYGKRITELHIRQSNNHIWSEVFGPGDINYPDLVKELQKMHVQPNLVLEQCLEEKSPNTTTAADAHRQRFTIC